MNKKLLGISRIIISLFVLVAIIVQLMHGFTLGSAFSVSNFFSFFTIEANSFALIVLFIAGIYTLLGRTSPRLDMFRGAATLYMVITGITYFLLLRGFEGELNTPIPWINFVLHYAFPVVIFIDWIISPLVKKITFKKSLIWIIFPITYLIYSLVRGPIVNWYPYPFLNPFNGGYGKVVIVSIGITVLTFGLIWLLTQKRASKA